MKEEIKKILLDCIYTPDAKPRFVGGDLDKKLSYIDYTVERIIDLQANDVRVGHASHYLCDNDDDGEDGNITMLDQIELIENQAEIDGSVFIDNVQGVIVWEKLEWSLTCDSFLEML